MTPSPSETLSEQRHFANIVATFRQYGPHALAANNKRRKDLFSSSRQDREILESLGYRDRLNQVDEAILENASFLNLVVSNPEMFGPVADGVQEDGQESVDKNPAVRPNVTPTDEESVSGVHQQPEADSNAQSQGNQAEGSDKRSQSGDGRYRPSEFDMDKLRSTLKQFVRDWSSEGESERSLCYGPMKTALLDHFSDIPQEERLNFRVLVPGAGLGRLAWDVAQLGFACQGNEFSYFMLLASHFMLNRTTSAESHTIYPYVHSFSNIPDRSAILRPVLIPDVPPTSLPDDSDFSLVAGDFEEIYGAIDPENSHEGQWDAVLTCFFIDTAKNIVNYLRIIHSILAPGGVWINLGPLLWHWENNDSNDRSIELDLQAVKALAEKIGFIVSNERTIKTTYASNPQSMLGYVYDAAFWTATKAI